MFGSLMNSFESKGNALLPDSIKGKIPAIPIIVIFLISFAVYSNALFNDFVYDDRYQVLENPWIRGVKYIPDIFSKSAWGFKPDIKNSDFYRPLMHIVYMMNYHFFGLRAWGFHLVNIFFHCGVSVLVFLVIRRLMTQHRDSESIVYFSPPFVAALLFASHPIHTEAVTWIAGLPDVACAFFYLLSFFFYVLSQGRATRYYLLSILSFFVAALFKEPALTLPIVLIAYDYLVKRPDKIILASVKRYIPYVAILSGYLLMRYYALSSFVPVASFTDLSSYQLIINILPLFREYLAGLLWPFDLNFWHSFHPVDSLFEMNGIISVVVAGLFIMSAVAAYRKNRLLLFGLLLVVVPLAPAFYIKAISWKPFAERYLYLPSVGFAFVISVFMSWTEKKLQGGAKWIAIVFLVIAGLFTVKTIARNSVWRNGVTLFSDTVKKSPDEFLPHYNLGTAYAKQGRFNEAAKEFRISLGLRPDYAEALNNLGAAYVKQNRINEAINEFNTALHINPDDAEAHNNLGAVHVKQNRINEAINEFNTAVKLRPDYADAHNDLGAAYVKQNRINEAVNEFRTALRIDPDDADTHYNLGVAYVKQGRINEAVNEFKTAVKLRPDYAEAHNNLGNTFRKQDRINEAINEFKTAVKLRPDYAEAHNNLGAAYVKQNRLNEAVNEFNAALRIDPDDADTHYNLGVAYVKQNRLNEAVNEFNTTLKLKPDDSGARHSLEISYERMKKIKR
jgi:Flp pilus assembly protein TadD